MPTIFQPPRAFIPNASGVKYPGAKAYFFQTGTTTPKNSYTDFALSVAHAHPVVADANGDWPTIYLSNDARYRVTIKQSDGTLIYTQDDVGGPVLTASEWGQIGYPRTAAETSASITPTNYYYPELYVDRYGTNTTPGTTDMTTALRAAVSVASSAGGGTIVFGNSTYLLSTTGTHSVVVPVAGVNYADDTQSMQYLVLLNGLNSIRWIGNGTTLKSSVTGGGCMFLLDDVRNFECEGINVESVTAHDATGALTTTGMIAFGITSQTRNAFNFKFTNLNVKNAYVAVYAFGAATSAYRVRGITIDNLYHDKGQYTLAFHNNGDNVKATGIHSSDCLREYFIYGVSNHDVQMTSDTAVGGYASNIKAYDRDTTQIKYKLKTSKNSSSYNVNIESQHHVATQPTPCRVIGLDLDVDNSEASAGNQVAVYFGYYQDAALQATAANNLWTGIRLRGIHRQAPVISTAQTGASGAYGTLNTDDIILLAGSKTGLFLQTGFVDSKQEYSTYTPVIKFGGNSVGMTYTSQVGEAWRDGQFVEILVDITLSAKGSSAGTVTVSLPFASSSKNVNNAVVLACLGYSNLAGLTGPIVGFVTHNGTTLALQQQGAAAVAGLTEGNFTNTSRLLLQVRYPIT